jgi:hypothetical protein
VVIVFLSGVALAVGLFFGLDKVDTCCQSVAWALVFTALFVPGALIWHRMGLEVEKERIKAMRDIHRMGLEVEKERIKAMRDIA